jgi:phenylpropionate dioxygenase-like ring-hydroxylating dioxygenase large terminal subunit
MAAPRYADYLAQDSRPVPQYLQPAPAAHVALGTAPVAAARYTSREFFELECQRLWPYVWQMVCREEELPAAGSFVVYDIVDRSFIVMRGPDGQLRAFHNSCPHRGRQLLAGQGHVERVRCGFHGFTWATDGALQSLPCRWDFEHVPEQKWQLPQVRVETWGGFVFLNMDAGAPSLADYLGVLPAHFERWRLEDCWKAAHVAKVIDCNWKVAQEAFMESYHVIATHPQILGVIADANSQYDLYGEHVNRNIAAFGAPSPHLGEQGAPAPRIVEQMLAMWGKGGAPSPADAGVTNARAVLGDINRRAFSRAFAGDFDTASDAELLDAIVYNVFPNFSPWGGFAPNIVYRWRPNGRDVDSCIMEVMLLKRLPRSGARPAPVPVHWLSAAEPWAAADELPILGAVIDQDMQNMPFVQRGLRASGSGEVQLGAYQESRIRHFHQTLDRYLQR